MPDPRTSALAALSIALASVLTLSGCATEAGDDGDAEESEAALVTDPAYARGKRHSTMTAEVIATMKGALARGNGEDGRFIKVGDSITYSTDFLDCLDTPRGAASLAGEHASLEPTRAFFDNGSWNRRSKASTVGWHTWQPITGSPSPVDTEAAEMKPSFAIVMLGTNDNYVGTDASYRRNLGKVIDALLAKGIAPIMSTIPPRTQAAANANIPQMNEIVRGVAAAKKVPLMDFAGALASLPNKGLSRDGIHPNVGSRGACDFTASGLSYGYNVRTLLALEAMARVKRFVLDGAPAETP